MMLERRFNRFRHYVEHLACMKMRSYPNPNCTRDGALPGYAHEEEEHNIVDGVTHVGSKAVA